MNRLEIRDVLKRTALYARVLYKTRALFHSRPAGLLEVVRSEVSGVSGPSVMYRVNAKNLPEKNAIVSREGRRTFRELDRRIDALGHGLVRRRLLGPLSALIIMRNRPELLEAQTAVARLGGSAVCVSWRSTSAEIVYLADHAGANVAFVESSVADALIAAKDQLHPELQRNLVIVGGEKEGFILFESIVEDGDSNRAPLGAGSRVDRGDGGAIVIYTSGTTGKPKGAVRRFSKHAVDGAMHFIDQTPIRSSDRHLVVCPMYHSTALGFLGLTFLVGGTLVLDGEFDPERTLAAIDREHVTTTAMVPTMLHRILELGPRIIGKYDTRTLRAVFSSGSSLSAELARAFMDAFGYVLYNFYGSTETGINTLASPQDLIRSPGTIGRAVPGNEIRLLDDRGKEVPVGQTGELFVRNTMLVDGYHRDTEATVASMREGFFSVGDLGHVDARGFFHLDGRKRDMIITGGVNVYPVEVEGALLSHPAVAEAAAVGVSDREWGERVRAFVSLRPGERVEAPELIAHVRQRLSGAKVPREVVFLPELPKNPTGKILKNALRSLP